MKGEGTDNTGVYPSGSTLRSWCSPWSTSTTWAWSTGTSCPTTSRWTAADTSNYGGCASATLGKCWMWVVAGSGSRRCCGAGRGPPRSARPPSPSTWRPRSSCSPRGTHTPWTGEFAWNYLLHIWVSQKAVLKCCYKFPLFIEGGPWGCSCSKWATASPPSGRTTTTRPRSSRISCSGGRDTK